MKSISVIIPAYNRESLIGDTLRSVMNQTRPPEEVIVVDDGSTDGTVDAVRSFDSSIKVICQENQGAGAARNRGLQEASGDFIHFMDSDDLSSLNTYECQLQALESAQADVAYGPWVKTQFDRNKCYTQTVVVQQKPLPARPAMNEWVLRGWVTVFQPCLFRREMISALGGYRVDLKPTEDSELLFRIGKSGAKLVHTSETLVVYRVHPEGQVSVANADRRHEDWLRFLSVLDSHIKADKSLSSTTRRAFQNLKLESINQGTSASASQLVSELLQEVPKSQQLTHRLSNPIRRAVGKVRRSMYGDNYIPALGVERVNETHKRLFNDLGLYHSGFYSLP